MFELISANLTIILCFFFGIGLLIVEVFMPGFGLPGISGIVLEVISVVLVYTNYGGLAALGMTIVILAVIGITISIALRSASAVLREVSTQAFYTGQPLFGAILSHLEARGFHLHALGENISAGAPFNQTDALFLRS